MRDLVILLVHVIATVLRLVRPGGVRAVVERAVRDVEVLLGRSEERADESEIAAWSREGSLVHDDRRAGAELAVGPRE